VNVLASAWLGSTLALLAAGSGLDRELLIANLQYGVVRIQLDFRMSTGELELPSRQAWLEELIGRYSADKAHPVAHLERARIALAAKDIAAFRQEVEAGGKGLVALWKAEGDAFEPDLRFLYGYFLALAGLTGSPRTFLEGAETVLLDVFERDASYWQAAEQLARVHFNSAILFANAGQVDNALKHLDQAGDLLDRALHTTSDVYALHELRALVRQNRLVLKDFDPEDAAERAELLDVWRDWRAAAQYFEEPAAARACAAAMPVGIIGGLLAGQDGKGSMPEDLREPLSQLIEDLEAGRDFEVLAGRSAAWGWYLRLAGKQEGEAEALARATELYEDPASLHAVRILVALQRADCALAKVAAAAGQAVDDDNVALLVANARLDCGEGEPDLLVRERLAKQPSNNLRCGLAVLLLRMGQDEEAVRELQAVLEDEPSSFRGHFDLGTALALRGELEPGLEHLKRRGPFPPRPPLSSRNRSSSSPQPSKQAPKRTDRQAPRLSGSRPRVSPEPPSEPQAWTCASTSGPARLHPTPKSHVRASTMGEHPNAFWIAHAA
jgi:tetratricopeptide (TPR) repeat protein